MGLLNKLKLDKVKDLAEKNAPKIAQGVDKATDVANRKTKGRFGKHLGKVDEAARKFAAKAQQNQAEGSDEAASEPAGQAGSAG